MKIRNIVTGAVVAAVVATTAACGSDDSASAPPVPQVQSSAAGASSTDSSAGGDEMTNAKKVPSVGALDDMLQKALDPKIKPADKTELVEGSEVDPALFTKLVKAAQDNPDVTYKIKRPVLPNGPKKASVKVEIKLPDNPATKFDAAIVYDKGHWKLSKSTVCPLLTSQNVKTPLCPSDSKSTTKKKAG